MTAPTVEELANGIRSGERRSLARAITLVESSNADHRRKANRLLDLLTSEAGDTPSPPTVRLGVSGTPGVGKSSVIDRLGMHLIQQGHRPAVLAIDPSSVRSGGSILGDKTRMHQLIQRPEAFVRPTANRGRLGGVSRSTRHVIELVEAAGHDVVIVETVGVGQSETAVDQLTDLFLLLLAPGGGDDLQGIKGGVIELVDLLVINKADGERRPEAERTAQEYRSALSLTRPKHPGRPAKVMTCSAVDNVGIDDLWSVAQDRWNELLDAGVLDRRRSEQRRLALWRDVEDLLLSALLHDHGVERFGHLERAVIDKERSAASAAQEIADQLIGGR